MSKLKFEVLFYPGKIYSDMQLNRLVAELRMVTASCLDTVPYYQALSGKREDLEKAIIAVARNKEGKMLGFCSALALDIEDHGKVFHTGLTCVHPDARGKKLTHKLTSKVLLQFLMREALFQDVWISNCACVLSSIGNVAMYFEDIYPSPYGVPAPSPTHIKIAQEISKNYREQIAINEDAIFDQENFVFRGSVEGTSFEKNEADTRFHHRNQALNAYYQDILNFDNGDEVLQIGKCSLFTFPRYMMKRSTKIMKKLLKIQDKELIQSEASA